MIYDLKELNERLRNTEWRNDSEKAESIAWMLFGIAERLEALVDAQKLKCNLVELKLRTGNAVFINPKTVLEASVWHQKGFQDAVALITESCDREQGELVIVEGTLAEVMAKIRGDK